MTMRRAPSRAPGTLRALFAIAIVLAAGAFVSLLIAWASALLVDLSTGPVVSGESVVGDVRWDVKVQRSATAMRVLSDRQRGGNWTPTQATGKPDTPALGDITTAWAAATPDGSPEW